MAQKESTTELAELLLQCMAEPDPMLTMLEWLCEKLIEAKISTKIGEDKSMLEEYHKMQMAITPNDNIKEREV